MTTNSTNNSNNVGRVVIGEIGADMHTHAFTDSYEKHDSSQHIAYCACGSWECASHVWGKEYQVGTKYYVNCLYCNEQRETTMTPIPTPFPLLKEDNQ